jgi:hypothetical protein
MKEYKESVTGEIGIEVLRFMGIMGEASMDGGGLRIGYHH